MTWYFRILKFILRITWEKERYGKSKHIWHSQEWKAVMIILIIRMIETIIITALCNQCAACCVVFCQVPRIPRNIATTACKTIEIMSNVNSTV